MTVTASFVPLRELLGAWDEPALTPTDGQDILDRIGVEDFDIVGTETDLELRLALAFEDEIGFQIPGVDGLGLYFGSHGSSNAITVETHLGSDFAVRLLDVALTVRLPPTLIKPVTIIGDRFEVIKRADGSFAPYEIRLDGIDVTYDLSGSIGLTFPSGVPAVGLPPGMVGDTGIVIDSEAVTLHFDKNGSPPPGQSPGFQGLYMERARVRLPEGLGSAVPDNLVFNNCSIGTGGFSGKVTANWSPAFSGNLFGAKFNLEHFNLEFIRNTITQSDIYGSADIPFFDEPVSVGIGVNLDGSLAVKLVSDNGLYSLTKENVFNLELNSIGFKVQDGGLTTKLSGRMTPLLGKDEGLDWPSFEIKELAIDSGGNVHLEGGWLDLREQYSFDFRGFKLEITKLGFGKTDDGGKWIGFSGGLKLAEGLPAGASVEGLRLTWYEDGSGREPKLTFNGVGVEFEVPEVLSFKGAVSYSGPVEVDVPNVGKETVERFDGAIKLNLKSLNMQVDGTLVVGSATGARGNYNFFAVYLAAELPAGIPLWSTGLAVYGMAGLFALRMEPNRRPNEGWYESPDRTPGWYKRGEPGVTDLKTKWDPSPGSVAFGAGVTIGTLPDNGLSFHGKLLFLMVFPGPIVMLEGRGNLLKERAGLNDGTATSEPLFRALAVLDNRAGNLTVGLDAQYKYAGGGELIEIRGGAEAYFDFRNADAWHVYLGEKEPRERRIRAQALKLFEANAYFMLDAHRLAMGAWIGYDKSWKFGPLSVVLQAWLEGNAALSFKPPQFHGDLWLHGRAELRAFGIGLGVTADAQIVADVFTPFHLLGRFSVALELPWPLPDPKASVTLEWGPEPTRPPLPLPLKEIAVEHLKVTTSWPLPRNAARPLLLPNYDPNGDGFIDERTGPDEPADLNKLPVVPLDGRPHLTFGRHVNDDARVGVRAETEVWERIGDPASGQGPVRARYGLKEVVLDKRVNNGWDPVAQKPAPAGVRELYGSWAPVPPPPEGTPQGGGQYSGQTKLWLWSKTPFDYSRHSGRALDEWFTDRFGAYPCVTLPPDRETCHDFGQLDPEQQLRSPWTFPDRPGLTLSWAYPETQPVTVLEEPVAGLDRALCFENAESGVTIELPEPAKAVRLVVVHAVSGASATGYDAQGRSYGPFFGGTTEDPHIEVRGEDLVRVVVSGDYYASTCLLRVCTVTGLPERRVCSDFQGVAPHTPFSPGDPFPGSSEIYVHGVHAGMWATVEELSQPVGSLSRALCVYIMIGLDASEVGVTRPEPVITIGLRNPARAIRILLTDPTGVEAIGYREDGQAYGPFFGDASKPYLEVAGEDLVRVELREGPNSIICIAQVCALQADDLNRHLRNELARWSHEGEVLEPNTTYRLKTVTTIRAEGEGELAGYRENKELTEYAYFRTGGPPGLEKLPPPQGHATESEFESGLDDLTRYVRYTVPNSIPAPGQRPLLPRPVYRAYDVGARFNEDYVELMYRLAGRDLGLYLYDNNDRPVRDAEGRLIMLSNRWGRAEEATLTEGEERWLYLLGKSECVPAASTPEVLSDTTLVSAAEGQVLDADTLYEARFVPLLLHEVFSRDLTGWRAAGGTLSDWERRGHETLAGQSAMANGVVVTLDGEPDLSTVDPAFDFIVLEADTARPFGRYRIVSFDNAAKTVVVDGALRLSSASSRWEIPGLSAVVAKSSVETTLVRDGSDGWGDYRLSALLRSTGEIPAGLAFRYGANNHHYRFAMDRDASSGRGRRRLEKVVGGVPSALVEDEFDHQQNRDYLITVEAIGPMLRVYQDGALVFEENDPSLASGGVGLYSGGSAGARFSDVRVDDLGVSAPVAYRFGFTTSQFANFFHHLHSFQDESWRAELALDADVAATVGAAVPLSSLPPAEAESRAYEALARRVLGAAAAQDPSGVEVTRVEGGGETLALMMRGPEPIDWKRTGIELLRAERRVSIPTPPRDLKLTDVTLGASRPNEESVTLLLREAAELAGRRIEYRAPLLDEPFDGLVAGLWAFVDEGDQEGPSQWDVVEGELRQTSNIYGGDPTASERPGTLALAGETSWTDYGLSVALRSEATEGAIGTVFRYQDEENYYRFSIGRAPGHRRLIRKAGGTVSVLWEDAEGYAPGREYALAIECVGGRLLGYLDGASIFDLEDVGLLNGRVGLYCWRNPGARFVEARVVPITWTPYYTFGEEARLPAGTRVRVHAGNATKDSPPEEPGVVRRFVASGMDDGQLRLPATGTQLRVAPVNGTEGHARHFLPDDAYAIVSDVRVLRKADGTGFFLLIPATSSAGSRLAVGQYRLRLTYRRDNTAMHRDSLVLSEAGNTVPERVTLDVPWSPLT